VENNNGMLTVENSSQNSVKSLWITLFIYLSIFVNSYVLFADPFEFYLGYLVYIVLLPVFILRHGFNRSLVGVFLILLVTGVFNILLGNNTFPLFFKVFTGLLLSYFFYYYVILEFECNVELLFKWYLKGAYITSVIGLFQFFSFQIGFTPGYDYTWLFNKWGLATGGLFGIRINSILSEPAYIASLLSAAFFVSVYNIFRKEPVYLSRFKSAVIVVVYLLSFSSLGQSGIFLTLIMFAVSYGLVRYMIFIIPAVIILFNVLYQNVPEFKDRYDGLMGLYNGEEFKLGKTHGSSFILYNNYVVTKENFKSNFVFGTGIGSHPVAFEKYSLAKHIKVYGFSHNSADANSMLLRLISETGLFGTSIFLFIVFRFYVKRDEDRDTYHWLVSNGIFIMMALILFRQGHYFFNGFPFFVLLYIYNYLSYHGMIERKTEEEESTGQVALQLPDKT